MQGNCAQAESGGTRYGFSFLWFFIELADYLEIVSLVRLVGLTPITLYVAGME